MTAPLGPPAAPGTAGASLQGPDAATPMLLLPVHVETRFMDTAAGPSELWVRIYPDAIAIDAHEPGLTDREVADGQAYWDAVWRAGTLPADSDRVKAPWRGLAGRYGAERAAWLALQLTPTNLAARPVAATPDGAAPTPPPAYPPPPRRAAAWTRPARAAALPEAWTVVAVAGTATTRFRGGPIQPNLAISLSPPAAAFPPGAPVDAGMLWLVDFEAAVAAGMACKVPLTAAQRAAGFDRVFVYGLPAAAASGEDVLAALLDDHHYTDGLALVPQGAPTNNTPNADAAWSRRDPDFEVSFAVERQAPLNADPDADGNALAAALGVDAALFGHVREAGGFGVRQGRDMLTALWPATLGYFFSQLMADAFTPDQVEAARQYVLAHAVPRGPLPACRAGRTPYGILPVTSLRRYQAAPAAGAIEPRLAELVLRLWPSWLAGAAGAPRLTAAGDPDRELVEVLGMDASSMTFRGRQAMGDDFLWNYVVFQGVEMPVLNTWWTAHLARGRQTLDALGYRTLDPRVIHLGLGEGSFPVPFATVQDGPLSETAPLAADADLGGGSSGNYIQWLRRASFADLRADAYPGPRPSALLYKLLRQSVILDYAGLAIVAEIGAGRLAASQVREQEIVDVIPPEAVGTARVATAGAAAPATAIAATAATTGAATAATAGAATAATTGAVTAATTGAVTAATAGAATAATTGAATAATAGAATAATAGAATAPATGALGVWEVLARPAIPDPAVDWATYLQGLDPPASSPFARLAELRASLDRLATLPTAELDRLLTESLDACSHRLDVWSTAVATAILQRQRASRARGVHLGAFGWVEEVRPASPPAAISGIELTAVRQLDERRSRAVNRPPAQQPDPDPIAPAADNGGYVLAPSLTQAATAAVLRSGYLARQGTAEEALLAIDLSSARVREALRLLAGVRQGQTLNALLGYLFESGLHDAQLDKYVQPFRDRFPVVANKLTPGGDPSAAVAASNVVDGLALRTAWDAGQLAAGQVWGGGLPGPGADQDAVVAVLQAADDHAAALGDVALAEAVFQIVRGNFGRAGTLLDAISQGARPPDPDVVATPRGGIDLTHRVALLLAGDPAASAAWSGVAQSPRAVAEPWLDAWLSGLLPDPAAVACAVRYHDAAGDHQAGVTLRDLDVRPLDVLAMADGGDAPRQGELEARIVAAAALPAGATAVRIDFAAGATGPGNVSFPDALFLAKALRGLISAARPLAPQDLALPETDAAGAGGAIDLAELRARAGGAVAGLRTDLQALASAAAGLPGTAGAVRDALLRCSRYGVAGAVPAAGAGADPGLAAAQAAAVGTALQDRLGRAAAVDVASAAVDDLTALARTIFGAEFVLLPRFTPPDLAGLRSAFAQSAGLVASDPAAPARWLAQLSHVRSGIARLDDALTLARLLGAAGADPAALLLGQLPATAADRWLALPIDLAQPPAKGRVALACIAAGDPLAGSPFAGLLVDEWPERIPSARENAAIAFHYAEPKARAPQALLLGVCPDARPAWDDDLVTGILEEAIELAKIRAVDLDSVQDVGQILPALYFPLNVAGATPSVSFTEAAAAPGGAGAAQGGGVVTPGATGVAPGGAAAAAPGTTDVKPNLDKEPIRGNPAAG